MAQRRWRWQQRQHWAGPALFVMHLPGHTGPPACHLQTCHQRIQSSAVSRNPRHLCPAPRHPHACSSLCCTRSSFLSPLTYHKPPGLDPLSFGSNSGAQLPLQPLSLSPAFPPLPAPMVTAICSLDDVCGRGPTPKRPHQRARPPGSPTPRTPRRLLTRGAAILAAAGSCEPARAPQATMCRCLHPSQATPLAILRERATPLAILS